MRRLGCDKTVPAQLMGGISANKPILPLLTGPMMPGSYRGQRLGACTDCRNNWAKYRAGEIDIEEISAINEELAPTVSKLGPEKLKMKPADGQSSLAPAALWAQQVPWRASLQP